MAAEGLDHLAGARVLVAGAGVTGAPTAKALLALGAEVTVTDASAEKLAALATELPAIDTALGLTEPPAGTRLVVTSPGWRPSTPLLAAAAEAGIEVIGEVELAWRICATDADPPTWLVVTGTNGKTTTVSMLAAILHAAGQDAVACGNIGLPVITAVAAGHRVLAVELSSFQLYWSPSVRPDVGLLLNIAPDHLDWHGDLAGYIAAKARVLTGTVAIAGIDDDLVAGLLTEAPAGTRYGLTMAEPDAGQFGIRAGQLVDRATVAEAGTVLLPAAEVHPPGPSGVFDALAAAAVARAHGVGESAIAEGLRGFRPGGHRGVEVGELDGVRYLDDSKASNPHAAAAAIRAHDRVVWVAGGLLKGASVDELVIELGSRLVGAVLLGTDREVIAAALARHAPDVPVHLAAAGDHDAMAVMVDAVTAAGELAGPGDVVLLAPAGASWDMFTDYAHRGRAFAEALAAVAAQRQLARPGDRS
ncbi:MAG TPA: UDP-N-acetylmuramoyl-L-alanine--D-glutamate ligase [Pseudonocardiaceae bacterium]|nr:UDP-N-acetylmuramoyl-L-alanine--D-glutamate ligase [Pseudonocardiaceae bacterium]